jgi:uncharacterized radical SAM superfamily Fe-S cluster-containing enzyme
MRVACRTRSLCPECLRPLDAAYLADGSAGSGREKFYLEKSCPEHGVFRTLVWTDGPGLPSFGAWKNDGTPERPELPATRTEKGCPFDCGLCPEHARQTCCALLEVTRRCDMNCPLCYASAGGASPDPDAADIEGRLAALYASAGPANVQLSGGEPTLRDDLPHLIRLARGMGFPFVQINSNGLRLARDAGYAALLREAGLSLVYLQWDSVREGGYIALRGAPYLEDKERAVRNCLQAGLPVLFVATLVRGVNDGESGDLLRSALSYGPLVRGLHFQPAASFGRYPWKASRAPRITLSELMRALQEQSRGMIEAAHLRPPSSEHALCSFNALYRRDEDGGLRFIPGGQGCCAPACCPEPPRAGGRAERARDFTALHWGGFSPLTPPRQAARDDFDAFLAESGVRRRFTLSAMAFQDAFTLDLERTRRCHIHVVTEDKRLIPFCMYNMTSSSGVALYRKP